MAFTNISGVERPEDFHFRFHEGGGEVAWDDAHNVLSFAYVEPQTFWMPLPPEAPRTYAACLQELCRLEREGTPGQRQRARATHTSVLHEASGDYSLSIHKAPWCDGCVFGLNPDPDVGKGPAGEPGEPPALSQWQVVLDQVLPGFEPASGNRFEDWNPYGEGAVCDAVTRRSGAQSARCVSSRPGVTQGLVQEVLLRQQEPRILVLEGFSKAQGVTGRPDADYSLYADLTYSDGDHLWGQIAPFSVGTHDWEYAHAIIRPAKPVLRVNVYALFRGDHTGTVWFDDLALREPGSSENRLSNGGLEPPTGPPPQLDGVYVDSIEGWGDIPNFRREHFAAADLPLTFDTQTKRPVILNVFSVYEAVAALSEDMHRRGKLIMANGALWRWPWFAHLLDALGTETNWMPGGRYQPDDDAVFNFRRALSYQKPYLLLQNTDFERFGPEWVERYLQRSLFYGCFPGMFSEDASSNPYFENPRWYNRDRHLFAKYLPLIEKIHKAGWEPITHARVARAYARSQPSPPPREGIEAPAEKTDFSRQVYLERWGSGGGGEVYLTVLNQAPAALGVEIEVDWAALGLPVPSADLNDLISAGPIGVSASGTLRLELAGGAVALVPLSD